MDKYETIERYDLADSDLREPGEPCPFCGGGNKDLEVFPNV